LLQFKLIFTRKYQVFEAKEGWETTKDQTAEAERQARVAEAKAEEAHIKAEKAAEKKHKAEEFEARRVGLANFFHRSTTMLSFLLCFLVRMVALTVAPHCDPSVTLWVYCQNDCKIVCLSLGLVAQCLFAIHAFVMLSRCVPVFAPDLDM
jgi:hypothetical protein